MFRVIAVVGGVIRVIRVIRVLWVLSDLVSVCDAEVRCPGLVAGT